MTAGSSLSRSQYQSSIRDVAVGLEVDRTPFGAGGTGAAGWSGRRGWRPSDQDGTCPGRGWPTVLAPAQGLLLSG